MSKELKFLCIALLMVIPTLLFSYFSSEISSILMAKSNLNFRMSIAFFSMILNLFAIFGVFILAALLLNAIYRLITKKQLFSLSVRIIIIFPIALFALSLIISNINYGFSIFSEPFHPWYTTYTTKIQMAIGIFFMPATYLTKIFSIEILSYFFRFIWFIYAIFFSALISGVINYLTKNKKPA